MIPPDANPNEVYDKIHRRLAAARVRLGRPLTLAEKILLGHLASPGTQHLRRGESFLALEPDRVAMQDVSAQMALLQFMLAGRETSQVPATVHCDHLVRARAGRDTDLGEARTANGEVYDFLESASARYGLAFWPPGSGIIHQVILEHFAFPGSLIIGTDSHTSNAGGLGASGIGVGGSDAADVMAGIPWELKYPTVIGVHLKGKLSGWASAKDVILKLCGILGARGATDAAIEYFGDGVRSLSCTGKATIANMGAELGATFSIFPYDLRMREFLIATGREDHARAADRNPSLLAADAEVLHEPLRFYDRVIEIDLSSLEPHIVGPHSPDRARPLSAFAQEARTNGWPLNISSGLIGSCTNSSYEDLGRAADVARQALAAGLTLPGPLFISPGSVQIQNTIERDGLLSTFTSLGARVLASACGPCIGQWHRPEAKQESANSILSSFNRNFRGRNDGNSQTLHFIASPEIVMALTIAGRLDFNPLTDTLASPAGAWRLTEPKADELPRGGFAAAPTYRGSAGSSGIPEQTSPPQILENSQRLARLEPFAPWNGRDFENQRVLAKVNGKCTTDHISPAGPWLRFRGHLPKISENLLSGATNAFTGETGKGSDELSGDQGKTFAAIARAYQNAGWGWVIIGDENYGVGSSRELAAMSPRYLGATAVIAKSFARIHESNLKKQGLLALTFHDPADYDRIREGDLLSLVGLSELAPLSDVRLEIKHRDGTTEELKLRHGFTDDQLRWFRAGSALNLVRAQELSKA